jgi:hypothetical protein
LLDQGFVALLRAVQRLLASDAELRQQSTNRIGAQRNPKLIPDKLGTWVANQRHNKKAMSVERRRRLDAVGFVWDPYGVEWEKNFALLKGFQSREGHCRVRRGHQEGGFKLGTWVVNQRIRKNALFAERKQRLNAIGFIWRLK